MNYETTIPYTFQLSQSELATPAQHREIIMRHFDFATWLQMSAKGEFNMFDVFEPIGVTVQFELEEDMKAFMEYIKEYWIFLHD